MGDSQTLGWAVLLTGLGVPSEVTALNVAVWSLLFGVLILLLLLGVRELRDRHWLSGASLVLGAGMVLPALIWLWTHSQAN